MEWKQCTVFALAFSVALCPGFASKKKQPKPPKLPAVEQMTQDEKILQAFNRLAFGPRPGDVERVRGMGLENAMGPENAMGLEKWIHEQLHPDSIPENPDLATRLQPLDSLRMNAFEMVKKYPPNNLLKAMVTGKAPWPDDPDRRAILQRLGERYHEKFGVPGSEAPAFDRILARLSPAQRQIIDSGRPEEKALVLEALPAGQQFDLVTSLPAGQRQRIFVAASPALRRRMQSFAGPEHVVKQDLAEGKVLRAVYSNRQLEEVLTDFWYNHFNVFLDKRADRYLVTSYERDAIRPHVLGKFKDLLTATAESPAMLFYLDNFQSVREGMETGNQNAKRAKRGLNENYGRELMELHTLGVDGGYSQKDVTEVARCFTGWTIADALHGGRFVFQERMHDPGEKVVLGVTIPADGGIDDGYQVLDILSHHPATARFVSRSLAIRFVSDTPPQPLVDRMAATFTATDGDLRAVMETMLASPDFWAKSALRAKIKSPFEMVASALRATGADVDFLNGVVKELNQLGEPLYRKVEPTGYSNSSSEWMNSASLLGRLNFAINLTSNRVGGVNLTLPATSNPDVMAQRLIGTNLTADSRQVVEKGLASPPATTPSSADDAALGQALKPVQFQAPTPALVAGLILGSPDFQRR